MATKSRRAALVEQLLKKLQFCPMCGAALKPFGSSTSETKACPNQHGTAYVLGKRQGQKLGLFLEIYEE
jgi:hypothetical protein